MSGLRGSGPATAGLACFSSVSAGRETEGGGATGSGGATAGRSCKGVATLIGVCGAEGARVRGRLASRGR